MSDPTANPPSQRGVLLGALALIVAPLVVAGVYWLWKPAAKPVALVPVVVAKRDIPAGTWFTRENLPELVETLLVPEESLPTPCTNYVDDLVERRLARPVRAGQSFSVFGDFARATMDLAHLRLVALRLGAAHSVWPTIEPGIKVDILATGRFQNRVTAFHLLVNMRVIAVGSATHPAELTDFTFLVTQQEAELIELATAQGCSLSYMPSPSERRGQHDGMGHDIEQVRKLLTDSLPITAPPPRLKPGQ